MKSFFYLSFFIIFFFSLPSRVLAACCAGGLINAWDYGAYCDMDSDCVGQGCFDFGACYIGGQMTGQDSVALRCDNHTCRYFEYCNGQWEFQPGGACYSGPPPPPTCVLSGPNQINIHETGSFTATATGNGQSVARTRIYRAPATGSRPSPWAPILVADSAGSSAAYNWTPQDSDITAQAGNKWQFFCNAYYNDDGSGDATNRCTGDPWGIDPAYPYADCGTSDSILNSITGWIQGRVVTNWTTPYYSAASCVGCSGSCVTDSFLNVSCNGRGQYWGCNLSGAKYDEGGFKFDVGTSMFCAASGPPSGYEFTGWSVTNSRPGNPAVSGPCSGNICNASFTLWGSSAGDNNVWFSVEPVIVCPTASSSCTLSSSSEAADSIAVNWAAVTGVDDYKIERDGTAIATPGAGETSYTDNSNTVKMCGTYSYRISSRKAGCGDIWANCGTINQIINAPSMVTAISADDGDGVFEATDYDTQVSWFDNSSIENLFNLLNISNFASHPSIGWAPDPLGYYKDVGACCGVNPPATKIYQVNAQDPVFSCASAYSQGSMSCPAIGANLTTSTQEIIMPVGETRQFSYQVTFPCGSFQDIKFTGYDGGLIEVLPASSNQTSGIINVKAFTSRTGSTNITATAYLDPNGRQAAQIVIRVTVTNAKAWFQTTEGDVHAGGNITSLIPVACSGNCEPYLSMSGEGGFHGVVSYLDFLELGDNSDAQVSPDGKWGVDLVTNFSFAKRNFAYFRALVGMPTTSTPGFSGDLSTVSSQVYYSTDDLSLTNSVSVDTKAVILVEGNVIIEENIIVPVGSSLVVVASGDITFGSGVMNAHGIFVAGGKMTVSGTDGQFIGEGSFIANNFDLNRDLGVGNVDQPAELFIARPDIIVNTSPLLWAALRDWEELAP